MTDVEATPRVHAAALDELDVDKFSGIIRIANKPWRCTCADQFTRFEEIANPNYRPTCQGDIAPGERHLEYRGEAGPPWEPGTRYCEPCAVAVWGVNYTLERTAT